MNCTYHYKFFNIQNYDDLQHTSFVLFPSLSISYIVCVVLFVLEFELLWYLEIIPVQAVQLVGSWIILTQEVLKVSNREKYKIFALQGLCC